MKQQDSTKYQAACAAVGLAPKSFITKGLEQHKLHVKIEKIQPEEWKPIMKLLENNSSLVNIILEFTPSKKCAYNVKKSTKPSFNLAVQTSLLKSLSSSLNCSASLCKLAIINVALKRPLIEELCRGLKNNQSLEHLCLNGSILGQKSLSAIFPIIRKSVITHLDFTKCKLNAKSCSLIGSLLRSQVLERHTETWKHTLRYNNPDNTAASGVRRITLNGNPVGDEGCEIICTSLQDDYWVKAIDLQKCDITDEGAKMFLMMLEDNSSICVLDLRLNTNIKDKTIMNKIEHFLERNRKNDLEGFENGNLLDQKETVSAKAKSTPKRSISNINMRNSFNESRKCTQYESHYNSLLKQSVVNNVEHLNDIDLHANKNKYSPIILHQLKNSASRKPGTTAAKKAEENQIFSILDELKNDLEIYKSELYIEKEKTMVLESKVKHLEHENLFLKNKQESNQEELEPELLETIETSFAQFHNFLDMLKQAGYGELCQLVNK